MKNKFFLILILLCLPIGVFASVDTCTRTDDNLYVPDKIKYKSSMKDNILSTPCVNASEKVYDFANLFEESDEDLIYNQITNFINDTGLDMAIVTTNYNSKMSVMEYADDFYDYNDFSRDGILFLIDMDTREYYVSTTGKAMFYFDDNRIDYILDNLYSDMVNGDYKSAVLGVISDAKGYYDSGVITNKYTFDSNGKIVRKTPWLVLVGISLGVSFIVVMILRGKNKKVKISKDADKYLKGTLTLTKKEDRFLFRNTQKIYSPISDSGGSSGGFSSHSGSSGVSHGGGGRSF